MEKAKPIPRGEISATEKRVKETAHQKRLKRQTAYARILAQEAPSYSAAKARADNDR